MFGNMFSMVAILHWAKEVSLMAQIMECMVVAEQSTRVPLVSHVIMLLCCAGETIFLSSLASFLQFILQLLQSLQILNKIQFCVPIPGHSLICNVVT
jgi:hypothetical protein